MKMNNKVYIIAGIACLISIAYGINQKFYNNKLEFLLETYKAETTIQSAQFLDLTNNINLMKGFEYQRGFEAGKTQMGFAFVNGNSMHGYEDGYHSAIGQFGDSSEEVLEFDSDQTAPLKYEKINNKPNVLVKDN